MDTMEHKGIVVFESKQVRRVWHDEQWYFSVVDVLAALTDSDNPAVYWRVLKKRLKDEGSDQTVTKCNGFKMSAADGKMRLTDTDRIFPVRIYSSGYRDGKFKCFLDKKKIIHAEI
jgi:prophage antirepressor-like protein